MNEKNYYSSLIHDDPLTLGSGTYASINQIRQAIGKGTIVASSDLALAYNKLIE
jgi:hypothetical protein